MSRPYYKLLGNQYLGIEQYVFENQDQIAINLVKKGVGGLVIENQTVIDNVRDIPKKWNRKLPIYLTVNSSQVIHKEVENNDSSDEKLVYKAFPNIVLDEFHYEVWRLKSRSIVAISRKRHIDELLRDYQSLGLFVAGISLGILTASEIIDFLEDKTFQTNTHQIQVAKDDTAVLTPSQKKQAKSYDVNGIRIESHYLIAFAGILRFFGNSKTNGDLVHRNHALLDKYHQESFFSKGIRIMVAVLLSILLANFILFSYYYKKAEGVSQSLLLSQSAIAKNQALTERIRVKQEKIKGFVDSGNDDISKTINSVNSRIPSSILLDELTYNPLDKKIKRDEPIAVRAKVIVVSGITVNNTDFTSWIEYMGKIKGVNDVIILRFGKDEDGETAFSLKIQLK